MKFLLSALLLCAFQTVHSIPIDNGVVGDPEMECGPRSITINFVTENEFEGTVYVRNYHADETCRNHGSDSLGKAGIEIGFDTCGVRRERSLTPRGIYVSTQVVVSFHPVFVTKIDRAIEIRCFYMEADKTVSQDLEVSGLTTGATPFTLLVPMPVCRYDILDGGPEGDPVEFALVGQQVYHKWICDSDTIDTFCMMVYGCFVDDGAGDAIQLLDEEGCAVDKYLLGNLEYPTDLMAGREAHVFKYADRANLYFNCQIQLDIKEPDQECIRPECPEPPNRFKRAAVQEAGKRRSGAIQDVSVPHPLLVPEVDFKAQNVPDWVQSAPDNSHCLSVGVAGYLSSLVAVLIVATLIFAIGLYLYARKAKNVQ